MIAGARTYVVECFSPGVNGEAVEAAGELATAVAIERRNAGHALAYLGALLMPDDEVVLHLFTATSPDAVREASMQAGIDFERVLESVPVGFAPFLLEARSHPDGCRLPRDGRSLNGCVPLLAVGAEHAMTRQLTGRWEI